jgi:hypothetical protein
MEKQANSAVADQKQALASMHASIRGQALKTSTDAQQNKFAGMLWRQQRFIQNLERTGMRRNVMAVGAAAVVMFASQSMKGTETGSGLSV